MAFFKGRSVALGLATMVLGVLPATVGCGAFFQCEGKASCTTSTTTTVSGDFAYITTSADTVSEFNISSGTFVSIGSALSLGYEPVAISVAPSNSFVYIAAGTGIYLYSIGTTGALTAANSGNMLVADTIAAMDISPDGKYLFTLNAASAEIAEYSVNTTTGLLSLDNDFPLPTPTSGYSCVLAGTPVIQSCSIKVSPNKNFIVVAAGSAGTVTYPYNSTNGITTTVYNNPPITSTSNNFFSAAVDTNNNLYLALTNEVDSLSASSTGVPGSSVISAITDTGNEPRSIIVDGTSYVYWADVAQSQIRAYATSGGTLTSIGTYPTSTNVSALAIDNTGKYLIAVGFNASTGAQIFSISSTGALTTLSSVATTTSTTTYPALIATSH